MTDNTWESIKLIGLTGYKGCGKDTAADGLVDEGFYPCAIADPIKRGLEAMLGISEFIWDDEFREAREQPFAPYEYSPRFLAQHLGTDWGRWLLGEDVWINACLRAAQEAMHKCAILNPDPEDRWKGVVVTDVRFDNEAKAIRDLGGKIVRITRPGLESDDTHRSEAGVSDDLIDVEIINDRSVEYLKLSTRLLIWE